jgi:hypothetical protein
MSDADDLVTTFRALHQQRGENKAISKRGHGTAGGAFALRAADLTQGSCLMPWDSLTNKRQRTGGMPPDLMSILGGGRIVWNGPLASLEDWVQTYRLTQVSKSQCAWLQLMNVVPKSPGFSRNNEAVFNPANVKLELDALKAMRDRGERISKTIKQACVDLILESAKQQVCTTGKWMISVGRDSVDMNWEMFARATANGHLGCGAKVSPSRELFDTDKALIRIYVGDFTNKPEVQRVLLALQKDEVGNHVGFQTGRVYGSWHLQQESVAPSPDH